MHDPYLFTITSATELLEISSMGSSLVSSSIQYLFQDIHVSSHSDFFQFINNLQVDDPQFYPLQLYDGRVINIVWIRPDSSTIHAYWMDSPSELQELDMVARSLILDFARRNLFAAS